MSETINLQELQGKLYERLKPSGWGDVLKGFLMSSEMTRILERLIEESADGQHFTPKLKQVFRAFIECPYEKLKVVLFLQCPYQFLIDGVTVADGIPLSCGNTGKLQPSLVFVHKEISDTLYQGQNYDFRCDLKSWSNQGVLLLNAALTTTVGKTDTHILLWRPFIVYLMDMLGFTNGGLIWLFMGRKSQEYMRLIGDNHYKLVCTHPASAAHQHLETWDSGGVFVKIHELLIKQGKTPINWK